MKLPDSVRELLLRYVDGQTSEEEDAEVERMLCQDELAREFLREVAEQAVMIADLERMAHPSIQPRSVDDVSSGVRDRLGPLIDQEDGGTLLQEMAPSLLGRHGEHAGIFVGAAWALNSLYNVGVLFISLPKAPAPSSNDEFLVEKVTGASRYFASSGLPEKNLGLQEKLRVGDVVETRSCDAWVTMSTLRGTVATIAGHSHLRILQGSANSRRIQLLSGAFWIGASEEEKDRGIQVETPTVSVDSSASELNIHTTDSETVIRVNQGTAVVRKLLDASTCEVPAGHQITIRLGEKETMRVIPQPKPVTNWDCRNVDGSAVLVGNWMPAISGDSFRIEAAPLLWPLPNRDPIMLYAVSVAAWKSSNNPVVLHSNSVLRFRGRLEAEKNVQFISSTQKIQGAFSGKFELDVDSDLLGPPGALWEVQLNLSDFLPLYPQLAASPEGLELTDVYALTVNDDVGLEIAEIELISNPTVP